MILASIDIGTNTALLLIAETTPTHDIRVLHDEARITRLGQGLAHSKNFHPDAQQRLLETLRDYKTTCDRYTVDKIIAVGTAGFRKAQNAKELVETIHQETGISVTIISGEEEAQLSYLSATHDFISLPTNMLALDIGGGSSELIGAKGGISFDVGAVVLTETFPPQNPPTTDDVFRFRSAIQKQMPEAAVTPWLQENNTLIGLAGSVTTLAAIHLGLETWDGNKVQGTRLSRTMIDAMIDLFTQTTVLEKSKIPGMVKGREDTILAGTLILERAMALCHVDEVIVSDRGLRYGTLYQATFSKSR